MKISPIRTKIAKFIQNRKFEKEARFLDNYVQIDNSIPNRDALKQIYEARKTIANYAHKNGVAIDISAARQEQGKHELPTDKLSLHVTDLLTNKNEQKIISARTDVTYPHEVPDYIIVDYPQDGIQQTRLTSHKYQDTFLRHLYRNIENLVESVQNRK